MAYKVVRVRFNSNRKTTILRGVSLEIAQLHCSSHLTHGLSNPHRPGVGRCDNRECSNNGRVVRNADDPDHCPVCGMFLHHDWFDSYDECRC